MENKVKNAFRDKFTKKEYTKGDSYSHEDGERVAFLVEKGYLEKSFVKTKSKQKAKK